MKKVIYSAALVAMLMLGACSDSESYTPQEILNATLNESTELTSYYAEYEMTTTGEDGKFTAKQWHKDGKTRVETKDENGVTSYAVNDGSSVMSYTESEKVAYKFSTGDSEGFAPPTLREQAQNLLEMVKDTHDISIGKDEKIAGRDTYHLIAKEKAAGSLFGDTEIWVDKKTWMMLKSVSTTADMQVVTEFTKFEPDANIEEAQFELELPADVTLEENEVKAPETITLDEAKAMHGSFLTFKEENGWALQMIENMDVEKTKEIALGYLKNEEPAITLSVFKPLEDMDIENEVTVRGQKGDLMEAGDFRLLTWDEDGLRYNIIFDNPDITTEEIIALTETMVPVQ